MVWLEKAAGASFVVADMPEVSSRMSPRPSSRYEPTIHQAAIMYVVGGVARRWGWP